MNLLVGLSEKKHFFLLKALSLWRRWVTVTAGLWEFPEMLRESCVKRDSAHGETEARGGDGQCGFSPSMCCPDISVWQNWQSSSNYSSQAMFHDPFFPKEFPLRPCPSSGSLAGDQQIQVQFCEACWILLGILSCLQSLSPSLLFTPRSFSSPLSWWVVVCVQEPLC